MTALIFLLVRTWILALPIETAIAITMSPVKIVQCEGLFSCVLGLSWVKNSASLASLCWITAHAGVTHSNCLNTARQHGACATGDQATVVTKLIWQDNLTWACQNNVRSSVFTNTLEEATEQIARDPNKALDISMSLLLTLLSQRTKQTKSLKRE